jgi:hypothetical protein
MDDIGFLLGSKLAPLFLRPRAEPIDTRDRDMDHEPVGEVTLWEPGAGADVRLGQTVHHLQRPAVGDPGQALGDEIGVKPFPGVLVGLKRDGDPRVTTKRVELELIEEGGPINSSPSTPTQARVTWAVPSGSSVTTCPSGPVARRSRTASEITGMSMILSDPMIGPDRG